MEPQWESLYDRIESYRIDDPSSRLTFIQRLARDNRWSLEYAWRVALEYKRFAFLSVAAGHPVTPSEDVDEAWHLHLLYTRSYWEEFCPKVLGRKLHHEPTQGGEAEHRKHLDWYEKTLLSYQRFFGAPPSDIWPPVNVRFSQEDMRVHVPRGRYWLVRKPSWQRLTKWVLAGCGTAALGWAPVMGDIPNPLDLPGPTFLWLYVALLILCFVAAWIVQRLQRAGGEQQREEADTSKLHAYELAWLAGGKNRAVDTAITRLVADGVLKLDRVTRRFELVSVLPAGAHPLDQDIVRSVQADGSARVVHAAAKASSDAWTQRLRDKGLLLAADQRVKSRLYPALIMGAVLLLGAAKLIVGISRGKPVGWLVVLMIVAAVLTFLLLSLVPQRSRLGDKVVDQTRKRQQGLKKLDWSTSGLTGMDAALAVALFGGATLLGSPWNDVRRTFASESGGGAYGGGCGGDGGGGGGGGGGCGGGGGGGCGGCSGG